MSDRSASIQPTHRFLFKPIEISDKGGCHLDVWIPGHAGDGNGVKDVVQEVKAGDRVPMAIMIHGGGFTLGNSAHIPYNQVNYFLDQGFAVCSIEYRMLPHIHLKEIREDLLDGYIYICTKLNADLVTAGCHVLIDTSRTCCMGWSAGGSCTVYLIHDMLEYNAKHAGENELPRLRAAVCTYPATDYNFTVNNSSSDFEKLKTDDPALWEAIQSLYQEPVSTGRHVPDWQRSKLNALKWYNANHKYGTLNAHLCNSEPPFAPELSPINLVTDQFPPGFIVVATADQTLETKHSYGLRDAWKQHGIECQLARAVDMPHGAAENPFPDSEKGDQWWKEALEPGLAFAVEKCISR